MLQKVQSELTLAHEVSIFQKMCIPKFIGMQCDKNNKGLNRKVQFFCVGCSMLDFLKLLNDSCNKC
jgi:hypothetical protein